MSRFAFLDTETDGLGPTRHVWEIGIHTIDDYGTEHAFATSTLLYPSLDPSYGDPKALDIGGYWERHPGAREALGEPVPGQVTSGPGTARQVLRATHRATIVGLNPSFDTFTLERILRGNGLAPTWHYHLVDVRAMALGWLSAQSIPHSHDETSDDLSIRCGVAPPDSEGRHTALADAAWVMRWFEKLTAGRDS